MVTSAQLPMCYVLLITHERFNAKLFVLYLGAIGLLWFFVWQLAIHGSPSEHPTITPEEKDYIEESIAKLPAAKVKGKLICCLT